MSVAIRTELALSKPPHPAMEKKQTQIENAKINLRIFGSTMLSPLRNFDASVSSFLTERITYKQSLHGPQPFRSVPAAHDGTVSLK